MVLEISEHRRLLQCFYGDLGVSWGFYEGVAASVAYEEEEEKKKPAAKKKKEERKWSSVRLIFTHVFGVCTIK